MPPTWSRVSPVGFSWPRRSILRSWKTCRPHWSFSNAWSVRSPPRLTQSPRLRGEGGPLRRDYAARGTTRARARAGRAWPAVEPVVSDGPQRQRSPLRASSFTRGGDRPAERTTAKAKRDRLGAPDTWHLAG